ncbi:MAG: asparagine synthase (glutamine-hydrolyzing) [Candidatus Aminicenantes bacterium]|nr:asparagine synthase (glutamine-hydrolyzing) [Candidatus Aminicenantes bacterium]
MCGLCGFAFTSASRQPDQAILKEMANTLIHRGPDDEGYFCQPGIGLAVRRLSIIDVRGGHQPLSNEDGTIWVAQNGEIYNFLELRAELEKRGHVFRTRSDTEVIAHSYEEWGLNCLEQFRGMFAFALWDDKKKRLILARDRIGVKPLYYTLLPDGTLVFGSEIKAILAYPGILRELDLEALDFYLTFEYIPAPYSIFKGIKKLPAAHWLLYAPPKLMINRYWQLDPKKLKEETKFLTLDQAMDELYEKLRESVQLRLISDVPLGAFLSGGIDSSTIVGFMRELGADPLRTFSIGFKESTYNELDYARLTAARFHTQHEEFILEPKALDLTEKLLYHLDEPLADSSIFPTYLVSAMARSQVTVALSGDGGDELFGGYEHYQAQKLAQWPLIEKIGRLISPLINYFPPTEKKKGFWNKLQRFTLGLTSPPELRHFRWMMFWREREKGFLYSEAIKKEINQFGPIWTREPLKSIFEEMTCFDPLTAELYLDLKTYLPDDIMVKVDRMSMATSLEAREPLLDHRLVEFVFALPGEWKVRGLKTKWIFKKTMERLLPKKIIYRPKEGFSIPIKLWLRQELRSLLLDELNEEKIRREGLFSPQVVKKLIDDHLAGRKNYSHQLWTLLVFEMWQEKYLVNR